MKIDTLLTVPFTGKGVSYTCGALLAGMNAKGTSVTLYAPYAGRGPFGFPVKECLPYQPTRLLFRRRPEMVQWLTEKAFMRGLQRSHTDAVYLFGETSLALSHWLHDRGYITVREKFNTAKSTAKAILDQAYHRLGLPPAHGITDKAVAQERERLQLTSFVFCPSNLVEDSLADYSIPRERMISTSYGFGAQRLDVPPLEPRRKSPVFLFVGSIGVRKGAHVVLSAWKKARIAGTLVLAGNLEPAIATLFGDVLAREDVVHLPYVADIGAVYRSADVFVFPTLEEGSPLVTYEALHCGLPELVSPMGAGRVIRDGVEGLVIDPDDEQGWIEAMVRMADEPDERRRLGANAAARASDYGWDAVAERRRAALAERIAPGQRATPAHAAVPPVGTDEQLAGE